MEKPPLIPRTPGILETLARWLWEMILWPYRVTNLIALMAHESGHGLVLWGVTRHHRAPSDAILLEEVVRPAWWNSLLPGRPLPQDSERPPTLPLPTLSRRECRLVSLGGLLASAVGLVGLGLMARHLTPAENEPTLFWLAWVTILYGIAACLATLLSLPDWIGLLRGEVPYLACGPAFAVRHRKEPTDSATPTPISGRLLSLVEILAREASTRGGQSGGFSILMKKAGAPSIIFDKVVKGKREDIVRILMERLRKLLQKSRKEGYSAPDDFEAILLHLRYATGGATHWHNAQPHWYEHDSSMIHHQVRGAELLAEEKEVFNMIAHNGDMDGVFLEIRVDGRRVRRFFTQMEARAFLLSAMPWTSSQGNSDSRSVAEWVDFHLTQGLVYKALRYAYFSAVLDYNEEIAAGLFDLSRLTDWAESVELALVQARKRLGPDALDPRPTALAHVSPAARALIRDELAKALDDHLDPERTETLLKGFEEAFFHHDLHWVMRRASRDLVGEFALMVCSTLEPRLGVFSLTQAFSIGHNVTRGEVFGSAEPLGVTTSLQQGNEAEEAYQIYLEDGQYALIEFEANAGREAVLIFDRAPAEDALIAPVSPSPKTRRDPSNPDSPCSWFPVNRNPKIIRAAGSAASGNDIAQDLREIPYLLRRVVSSFEQGGENHATQKNFSDLLFANLLDGERKSRDHDLVLFGVDFNQDLIGEFAQALRSILPGLRIRAENSGNVLKEMKRTKREGIGPYGPRTLFLGVSNSAQTQSTLAAMRKARDLVGPERCFVLSQNLLNSMSEAIGQGYHAEDPALPNTFLNLSHFSPDGSSARRRAEAATIVLVATQAVLTEILIDLTAKAIEGWQTLDRATLEAQADRFALRADLQKRDIRAFREFQSAVYEVDIPNRVGCNAEGEAVDSPDHEPLEREARARAENQIEFVRAYALFALYIIVATLFGVPLFAVLLSPLEGIPGIGWLAHGLDAALFMTALWLIHLGLRKFQGRPLFERMGARAEVYIDRQYIARIIERYNATLFSNAPAFITPFFYWADTVQDALHRYGVRAHRGVVTLHRTPDERMGIEEANNAAEENMVLAQLGGIRFNGGEPQSRDKVRAGSWYVDPSRPYQTVLSDSLSGLRTQYDHKLSAEMLRLINRRLLDLADGLITEFVIGFKRKDYVNRSFWEVVRLIPFAQPIYVLFLRNGIDLHNLAGEADTANQAQIQSTKHPVSPMDIHIQTMEPRSSVDALLESEGSQEKPFAVLSFSGQAIDINLNQHAVLDMQNNRIHSLRLVPGQGSERGYWVSEPGEDQRGRFLGGLEEIDGEEWLVIENPELSLRLALPTVSLNSEQQQCLQAPATRRTPLLSGMAA